MWQKRSGATIAQDEAPGLDTKLGGQSGSVAPATWKRIMGVHSDQDPHLTHGPTKRETLTDPPTIPKDHPTGILFGMVSQEAFGIEL